MAIDRALAERVLGGNVASALTVPLDAFLKGHYFDRNWNYIEFSRHTIIPLYVRYNARGNMMRVSHTSEGKGSYDVVVDTDGQVVGILGSHGSNYPISESNFSIGTKAGVKKLVRLVIKSAVKAP